MLKYKKYSISIILCCDMAHNSGTFEQKLEKACKSKKKLILRLQTTQNVVHEQVVSC